jgi:hypothetical protein
MRSTEARLWRELESAVDETIRLLQTRRTRAAAEEWDPWFLPALTEALLFLCWVAQGTRDGYLAAAQEPLEQAIVKLEELKEALLVMQVDRVTATVKYSAEVKGAWKSIELGAEASLSPGESWRVAESQQYRDVSNLLKQLWAQNGMEPKEADGPTLLP